VPAMNTDRLDNAADHRREMRHVAAAATADAVAMLEQHCGDEGRTLLDIEDQLAASDSAVDAERIRQLLAAALLELAVQARRADTRR
jgi:hypothetical protein